MREYRVSGPNRPAAGAARAGDLYQSSQPLNHRLNAEKNGSGRLETKHMLLPSGDQDGSQSSSYPEVNCLTLVPSAAMRYMLDLPSRLEEKRISPPSGEQAGCRFLPTG